MTQQQLHDEAREVYRRAYAAFIGNDYSHKDADAESFKAHDNYIARFQSHVTNPPRVEGIAVALDSAFNDFFEKQGKLSCEPVSNTNKLPTFPGPDWRKAPEWVNWCAQDKDGAVYWYEKTPQTATKQWIQSKGDVEFFAECYPPANWETAIWQRPDKLPNLAPNWSEIEEKYKWFAIDENGDAFAYEVMPTAGQSRWNASECNAGNKSMGYGEPPANWKNAIWQRP